MSKCHSGIFLCNANSMNLNAALGYMRFVEDPLTTGKKLSVNSHELSMNFHLKKELMTNSR